MFVSHFNPKVEKFSMFSPKEFSDLAVLLLYMLGQAASKSFLALASRSHKKVDEC